MSVDVFFNGFLELLSATFSEFSPTTNFVQFTICIVIVLSFVCMLIKIFK